MKQGAPDARPVILDVAPGPSVAFFIRSAFYTMLNRLSLSLSLGALLSAPALFGCGGETPPPPKPAAPQPAAPAPSTPGPTPPVAAPDDAKLKDAVIENLKKAQITGVTVEVTGGDVTLGGEIPKDKVRAAMQAANDAKPKKVVNKLNPQ
jgi:hypothetical protein